MASKEFDTSTKQQSITHDWNNFCMLFITFLLIWKYLGKSFTYSNNIYSAYNTLYLLQKSVGLSQFFRKYNRPIQKLNYVQTYIATGPP